MKRFIFFAGILSATLTPSGDAQQIEKRVGRLETRVDKVEDRVSDLERSGGRATDGAEKKNLEVQPLKVVLVNKKQAIGAAQAGIRFTLEFENLTSYSLNGFSGKLVFKPEGGDIYLRKISYSHLLGPGEKARIVLVVSSDDTKNYLKFVKAAAIKVVFIDQRLF